MTTNPVIDIAIKFHIFIDEDPRYEVFVREFFKKGHELPSMEETFNYFNEKIYNNAKEEKTGER